jgi:ATP-binding cassette subfamily B (MDR/TAP) protein 1
MYRDVLSHTIVFSLFLLLLFSVIAFTFMTAQATLLETAAGEMTEVFKTQWFEALLRQDMAYYDISDVSGTATIININGKKFRK